MNSILSSHERELENVLNNVERERQRQFKELQDQLAARRRHKQHKLQQGHDEQNEQAGIPGKEP